MGLYGEKLEIMSTQLAFCQHNGIFTKDQIRTIHLVHKAEQAIPLESRGRNFKKHERVATIVKGSDVTGLVVAAFDGMVVIRTDSGLTVTGGAMFFSRS